MKLRVGLEFKTPASPDYLHETYFVKEIQSKLIEVEKSPIYIFLSSIDNPEIIGVWLEEDVINKFDLGDWIEIKNE